RPRLPYLRRGGHAYDAGARARVVRPEAEFADDGLRRPGERHDGTDHHALWPAAPPLAAGEGQGHDVEGLLRGRGRTGAVDAQPHLASAVLQVTGHATADQIKAQQEIGRA